MEEGPGAAGKAPAGADEYLQLKGAHGQGVVHSSGSTSEDAVEPAQAEPDVRNAEAAHCEAEATGGGQERAADEASAYEHQPSPYKEQGPHTGASRQTHTQEPIAVDLATIKKRQADCGPQRPRGSITCRFCGGRHQSSHRMPKCRCEQPGWYEHMRPWSPDGHHRRGGPVAHNCSQSPHPSERSRTTFRRVSGLPLWLGGEVRYRP